MIKHLKWHLGFVIMIMCFVFSKAKAEVIINANSISVAGYSNISSDKLTIYGGSATGSSTPITGDGSSTTNTCTDTTVTTTSACNQSSVYADLKLVISFTISKSVANAKAKVFLENTSYSEVTDSTITITKNSGESVSLEMKWKEVCQVAGLSADCQGSTVFLSKGLQIGVDANGSGEVESDERKSFTVKFHHIQPGSTVTQSYCATTAAGAGVCNVVFKPGDEKVFIDSVISAGADGTSGSFDWESIAMFPIDIAALSVSQSTAFTGFTTTQADPIFRTIATDGTIENSSVTGSFTNGKEYCLVYANRNLAHNIYNFVTDSAAATTACVIPSEVVGLLADKHCFISTAAFGSMSSPEVEIFRQFRNQVLLNNYLGRAFVRYYYEFSPSLADVIAKNETLRFGARMILYPFLGFAYLSVHYGLLSALILSLMLTIFIFTFAKLILRKKKVLWVLIFLIIQPIELKAEIKPDETIVAHPSAKDGLVRIKKDGSYIYGVDRKISQRSSHLWLGQVNHPDISITVEVGSSTNTYNFQDFYQEESGIMLGYDYEWYPNPEKGRFGYQAGFGVMVVSGNGKLVSTGAGSEEKFTFITLPLNLGGIYRFEWKDKQLLAPYVAGGGTYLGFIEKREDVATPNFLGGFGFYGAAGALVNIGAFDSESGFMLESEYGVSNLWFSIELRAIEVSNDAFSFSNQFVNAGLSFDF